MRARIRGREAGRETAAVKDREERRRQILEAALAEFSEAGYHATKVSDIVARAGIAQGTFYLYFKDKHSIFIELLDIFFQKISSAITRIDVEQEIFPQIRGILKRVLSTLLDERRFTRLLLLNAVGLEKELDGRLSAFWGEVAARISAPLKEGQELGLVRAGDMGVVAIMVVGGIKELTVQRLLNDDPIDLEPLSASILDYNTFGVLFAPPPSEPR
jgi:AcrR family transcriptional regulator